MPFIIKVNDLVKKFGDITAVDGISFSVTEGDFFAFLGPNGAGKSTTINIISTLMNATSGSVEVDGLLRGERDAAIRGKIGVVFQDNMLDELLTVKENIEVRASFYGLTGAAFLRQLGNITEALNIGEFLNRRYGKLSGGQRRRADIARALINTPRVLFLDEPTTGLDPQTRIYVWDIIKKLRTENDMTVFLTTHYMEEAAEADDVAIIDHGKVVARGTPDELRVRYTKDILRVTPKGGSDKDIKAFFEGRGFSCANGGGVCSVNVEDSMQALELLKQCQGMIENFEVRRGSMDDVFVNITGHAIREGGDMA